MSAEDTGTASPEVEVEARAMGWRPQEEFRGKAENWVDADTYVKRGHEVLPLVKADNARLVSELGSVKSQNAALSAALKEQGTQIEALTTFQAEMLADKLKAQRNDILARIRDARERDDSGALATLEEELEEVKDAQKEVKEKAATKPTPAERTAEPTIDPAVAALTEAWKADNVWFGVDRRKTSIAMALGNEAGQDGLKGKAFFDYIDKGMKEVLGTRPPPGKTEEGGRPSGGASGDASGYKSLPADAKAKCDEEAKRFVGEKKAFKTPEAWRAHYAKLYFAQ